MSALDTSIYPFLPHGDTILQSRREEPPSVERAVTVLRGELARVVTEFPVVDPLIVVFGIDKAIDYVSKARSLITLAISIIVRGLHFVVGTTSHTTVGST